MNPYDRTENKRKDLSAFKQMPLENQSNILGEMMIPNVQQIFLSIHKRSSKNHKDAH